MEHLGAADRFRLGHLPTERPHPATRDLSRLARENLPAAVELLRRVDLGALSALERRAGRLDALADSIDRTLAAGRRVFLCGCGATGRLSLSLETLWREAGHSPDAVVSFMAGGDVALVHSLEGFEDQSELGARHLNELGFADGDLLIASTEGGETPFVIGATLRAAELSSNPPYFLYCNPDSALRSRVARFRRVHEHANVRKIGLYVGPMALAGSTRMQASTALQLSIGAALLHRRVRPKNLIHAFRARFEKIDLAWLPSFIERESAIDRSGNHVHYLVRDFGITVFTDTTERAPTFSLAPFEPLNGVPSGKPSSCYVSLVDAHTAEAAWVRLLGRPPRSLDWMETDPRTGSDYLAGFDFSTRALDRRRALLPESHHHVFGIRRTRSGIHFELDDPAHELRVSRSPALFEHLTLKQILNVHSTLVMGRLGRYESNLMTYVTPTNGKLVDRAVRYVRHLVELETGVEPSYDDVVMRLFDEIDRAGPDEPVVLRTAAAVSRDTRRSYRLPVPSPSSTIQSAERPS